MTIPRPAWLAPPAEQHGELSSVEVANVRLLGEARVVLVGVAMLMALLEPMGGYRIAAHAILAIYAGYSVFQWRRPHSGPVRALAGAGYFLDAACYTAVVALTGGVTSRFAIFLLFPVFAACLQAGLARGVAVAILSAAYIAASSGAQPSFVAHSLLDALPLGPVMLILVVAAVIARWAHSEVTIVRRLAFFNDVNRIFTPHHAVRDAICRFVQMLRAYQRAEACIVLLKDARSGGGLFFEVDAQRKVVPGEPVDAQLAGSLLAIPDDRIVVYSSRGLLSRGPRCRSYDAATLTPATDTDAVQVGELAQLLEARSLVSLPLQAFNQTIGRLHLTSRRLVYTRSDVKFLAQIAGQVALMIENMQLVERLTAEVATQERRKISRDLHDGTIQPYIGLKLGLEALHRKVVGYPLLVHEVSDLMKMAADGIDELRSYVGNLKNTGKDPRHSPLLPAIQRQAEKFSEYYGIRTEVIGDASVSVPGSLCDEVAYIVREGLSNIRRHTRARRAAIHVEVADGKMSLKFINEAGSPDRWVQPFFPRSIGERAGELGGSVEVRRMDDGRTLVSVVLPI